ncbi:polysaccharide lyase family 7 protein [Vibrio neonatus]|uniref:polysaccharide lyase family 7 protein n=1 Tax=Vibrio neonatus TaxID=278860 RepID=UPI0021C30DC5|nr:polysaccharide lyase family 7 protein [Vibrio neonatus]
MKKLAYAVAPLFLAMALAGCGGSDSNSSSSDNSTPDIGNGNGGSDNGDNGQVEQNAGWDINQWKLTLPVSYAYYKEFHGEGNLKDDDSAAELIPADCSHKNELTTDTKLPYFYIDANNRTHFIVDLGGDGIATTGNTNKARSELRELYNFNSSDRCSSSNQNWAISDSANHKLNATLNVERYPSGINKDPKVVIGQVHGYDIKQALIKLVWEGSNKPVRAVMNDSFVFGNVECNSCNSFSVDLGTAKSGTDFSYQIDVNSQGVVLEAAGVRKSFNWGINIENTGHALTPNWANSNTKFYFKAGIYPQIIPSSSYAGQVFDVSFSKIVIEHK